MHFRTCGDINYFYYPHIRNSFLKLCLVFVKRLTSIHVCSHCFSGWHLLSFICHDANGAAATKRGKEARILVKQVTFYIQYPWY